MGKGKSLHKGWAGFTPLKNARGIIEKAQCNKCKIIYVKRDEKTLINHSKVCSGVQDDSQKENVADNVHDELVRATSAGTSRQELQNAIDSVIEDDIENLMNTSQSSIEEENLPKTTARNDERNVLLLNFFLANNIDIDKVASVHCVKLFRSFDPNYQLPTKNELVTKIFKMAESQRLVFNHSQTLLDVLCIKTHECNGEVFALSLILTSDSKYIYINSIVAKTDHIIEKLENFCNESVKKVYEMYKKHTDFIVYDGDHLLAEESTVNESHCFRIRCLSAMIKDLRKVQFQVDSPEAIQAALEYYKIIDNLENRFLSCKYTLDDAVEDIFKVILESSPLMNKLIENTVVKFLTGPVLAANFFNYKQHGYKFKDNRSQSTLMSRFLESSLPTDAFDGLTEYKNKSGEFRHLFDSDYNKVRFWSIMKMHHNSLSNFALKLLSIPAVLPKVNMTKIIEMRSKLFEEKDLSMKALLFSIIVDDF